MKINGTALNLGARQPAGVTARRGAAAYSKSNKRSLNSLKGLRSIEMCRTQVARRLHRRVSFQLPFSSISMP